MPGLTRLAAVATALTLATTPIMAPSANAAPVPKQSAGVNAPAPFTDHVIKIQRREGGRSRGSGAPRNFGGGGGGSRNFTRSAPAPRSFTRSAPAARSFTRAPAFRSAPAVRQRYVAPAPRYYRSGPRYAAPRYYAPRPYYGPRYRRRGWGPGVAIGAGVVGAILLSEAARANYRSTGAWQRCADDFVSFDWDTGTIVTYDGDVVLCPYLN